MLNPADLAIGSNDAVFDGFFISMVALIMTFPDVPVFGKHNFIAKRRVLNKLPGCITGDWFTGRRNIIQGAIRIRQYSQVYV